MDLHVSRKGLMPPDPSNQSDLISSPPQLSLNYISEPYQRPEWMAVVHWIAGAAAVLGVVGTISFSAILPNVIAILGDVFSHRPRQLVGDLIWIAYWIIGFSSTLAVMWSAWWCILRAPSAARTLQWGCMGLFVVWIIAIAMSFYSDPTRLMGDSHADFRPLFFNLSRFVSGLIYDLALPVFLLWTSMHPATRRMMGSARDIQTSGDPALEEGSGTSNEVVRTSEIERKTSVAAGIAHIRFSVGITAMVIGAIAPANTLLFSLIFHETASWTMASRWSLQSRTTLVELVRNVVGVLLFAGGLAVLKHRRFGRRLLTTGALGTLAVIFYDRLFALLPKWSLTLTLALSQSVQNSRIITALILFIGLVSCQALRMTTADEDQFPHQTP